MKHTVEEIVWPFKVPDVCTAYWCNRDWFMWASNFRPTGYTGGMFDQEAYDEYKEILRAAMQECLASHYDHKLGECINTSIFMEV